MISEFTKEYRFLSNFYPCRVSYEGIEYLSVEHAYQAAKTTDVYLRQEIALLKTAAQAKKAGYKLPLRYDWEDIKALIMRDLVEKKFMTEPLRSMLLATGDEELVEGNWWGDTYWGVCRGQGQNMLGKILMAVRDTVR